MTRDSMSFFDTLGVGLRTLTEGAVFGPDSPEMALGVWGISSTLVQLWDSVEVVVLSSLLVAIVVILTSSRMGSSSSTTDYIGIGDVTTPGSTLEEGAGS